MSLLSPRLFTLLLFIPFTGLLASEAQENPDNPAISGPSDPQEVFATQGNAVLTQMELDAILSAVPEEQRPAMVRDGARMDQLTASLLKRKLVAADARKAGFEQDPLIADRVRLAAEKELAEAWLEQLGRRAPEADFEALAREDYLVNPDRYRAPVVVDVSHILIGAEGRGPDEAMRLARSIHGWLQQEPSRWDELVEKYSDDPSKGENGGRFPEVRRGQMVAPFERAAFAMTEPGSISDPVRSNFGYHIIRLNGRSGGEVMPFDEVRQAAVERARAEHIAAYRERYLRSLTEDPIENPDGAVEALVERYLGDDVDAMVQPEG